MAGDIDRPGLGKERGERSGKVHNGALAEGRVLVIRTRHVAFLASS